MDGGDEATNMERPRKKTDPDQWRAHKPTEIGPSDRERDPQYLHQVKAARGIIATVNVISLN